MSALTCPECFEAWPTGKKYHHCPRCEVRTRLVDDAESIPGKEAEQLLNAYDDFKVWLAKHPDVVHEELDLSRFDVIAVLERIPVLEEEAA